MTKQELSTIVAKKAGVDVDTTKLILELATMEIIDAVSKGENYYHRGFGTFRTIRRKEKYGRDMNRKCRVLIPAHNLPKFVPCKSFKEAVL